ncbi:MAG: tetratricopeptide repeat protein [Rhodospirillales bacterium]|nr:tetratricopeptide repeat protein [Rhodospirillales bacterium]
MADIFEEVEADLRADRARAFLVRYGKVFAAAAVAVALGVAAWQGLVWWRARQQRSVATAYFAAAQSLGAVNPAGTAAGGDAKAETAFARLTENNLPAGYRTLARLRAAALAAGNGQQKLALTLWQGVAQDRQAGPLFAGLARLLWVTHQIDGIRSGGDVRRLAAELRPLLVSGDPWRPMAEEATALIAIARGDKAAAKKTLSALRSDPSAPQGVRARAAALLVQLSE